MGSGAAPQPTNDLTHIVARKLQVRWQQFLLIFLRANVIFCTKTSLISYVGSSSSQVGDPVMSFSPGAVATVVLCKSAPMVLRLSSRSTFSTLVVRRQQRCGLWLQSTVAACFSSSFCVRNTLYAADTLSCTRRDATRRRRLHSGLEPLCCGDCGVNGWQMSRTT